jgi:DNA-binding beta-propeller fold protein YncE
MVRFTWVSVVWLAISFPVLGAVPNGTTYHAGSEIKFGGKGGWDYLSLDASSHRLFVSHFDRIVVIDTETEKVVKEILDTPGVHGIALATDLKKAFSSNGKEAKVSVIDLGTLETKAKITVREKPDSIVYDSVAKEVYVFNGISQSVSIIDANSEKLITTLPMPGKPEFSVSDPPAGKIFVNIEDKNSIAAIDTRTHKISAVWPLQNCESPSGLALDSANHRLFSVCENAKMVMVDSKTGATLGAVPTGEGTDGVSFDPGTLLAFSSNGKSGTVTIAHEDTPGNLAVVKNLKTKVGARTITIDPDTHKIYLPAAELLPAKNGERPQPVEGTQKIFVFSP